MAHAVGARRAAVRAQGKGREATPALGSDRSAPRACPGGPYDGFMGSVVIKMDGSCPFGTRSEG